MFKLRMLTMTEVVCLIELEYAYIIFHTDLQLIFKNIYLYLKKFNSYFINYKIEVSLVYLFWLLLWMPRLSIFPSRTLHSLNKLN